MKNKKWDSHKAEFTLFKELVFVKMIMSYITLYAKNVQFFVK